MLTLLERASFEIDQKGSGTGRLLLARPTRKKWPLLMHGHQKSPDLGAEVLVLGSLPYGLGDRLPIPAGDCHHDRKEVRQGLRADAV